MKRLTRGLYDTSGNMFDKAGLLYSLPEEFLAHFINSVSDMSSSDIVAAKRFDPAAAVIMCKFGLDLPAHLKRPRVCMFEDFMMDLLMRRHTQIGSCLSKLKESRTRDAATNQLNFKGKGCYRLSWRNGILQSVTHISWAVAELDRTKIQITRAYAIVNNFSDREAALLMEPLPPVHILGFFKASGGRRRIGQASPRGPAPSSRALVKLARVRRGCCAGGVRQAEQRSISAAFEKACKSGKDALDEKIPKRKYALVAEEVEDRSVAPE